MSVNVIGKQLSQALKGPKSKWNGSFNHIDTSMGSKSAMGVSHPSSLFMTYHPAKFLEQADFQSLDGDIKVKQVIKSRYGMNLRRTGQYFVRFESPLDLERFTSNIISDDIHLLGRSLTMSTMDKFVALKSPLRLIYPSVVPELEDLRHILKYLSPSNIKAMIDQKRSHLNNIQVRERDVGISVNDFGLLQDMTHQLEKDLKDGTVSDKTINRSQCVILTNLNYKIPPERVLDTVWDLELHSTMPLRRIMVHPSTLRAVDIVIFKTPQMAMQAVKRWNNQHGLYDVQMPYTTAELL